MSLGTITYAGVSYNDAGNGRYIASTAEFGGPKDELKITPGALAKKAKPQTVNAGFTRLTEYPVSSNPADPEAPILNKRLLITVQIQAEPGVQTPDIDLELGHISTALTAGLLNLIMNGAY